jgi:tRNA 2-thiocytidine biosynthesis protein TtcA
MDRNLYPFATLKTTGVADAAGDRAFDDDDEPCAPSEQVAGTIVLRRDENRSP